jgi:WD40 repeat protein
MISVYAAPGSSSTAWVYPVDTEGEEEEEEEEQDLARTTAGQLGPHRGPLARDRGSLVPVVGAAARWQGHGRWVSDAQFVGQEAGMPRVLVTSADDGVVAVWDLCEQWECYRAQCDACWGRAELRDEEGLMQASTHGSCSASLKPHDGAGVYAMQAAPGDAGSLRVWSCGKDGSAAIHTVRGSSAPGLPGGAEWRVQAHSGVCKSVAARELVSGCVVATGGNDRAVRVWDCRTGGARAVAEMGGEGHLGPVGQDGWAAHLLAVNRVMWTREGLLVSGSFDNTLCVWDCRSTQAPVAVIRTFGAEAQASVPVSGRPRRAGSMAQPVALAGGATIGVGLDGARAVRLWSSHGSRGGRPHDCSIPAMDCGTLASDGVSLLAGTRSRDVILADIGA